MEKEASMFVEELVELPASSSLPLVTVAFDKRTVLEMEIALTKACETLPRCLDSHENRCVIAKRILRRVNDGERTFGGMAAAGMAAVEELRRRQQQV
jgi:hypothetical protein